MDGVISTLVGYAGGDARDPTYRSIGDHTEALLVVFDPQVVTYRDLLDEFWGAHNPCSRSSWRQYRNAVFYVDDSQKAELLAAKAALEQRLGEPVATGIEPAGVFTPAEDYHQKYSLRQQQRFYQDLRRRYPQEADFVASTAAARLNGYLGGFGSADQLRRELEGLGLDPEARDELLKRVGTRVR